MRILFGGDRASLQPAAFPSPHGCVDRNDREARGENLPARPDARIKIEYRPDDPQWRNVKRKRDPYGLPGKREGRNHNRKREQAQRGQFACVLPPGEQAVGHQPEEQARGESWYGDVGFGLLKIMDEREKCDGINNLMQSPPAQTVAPMIK